MKSVEAEYKNPMEKVFRHTVQPIQNVVVIVPADYRLEEDSAKAVEARAASQLTLAEAEDKEDST
jgi:hypothetical protein